jgi:hypothetical protein
MRAAASSRALRRSRRLRRRLDSGAGARSLPGAAHLVRRERAP